MFKLSLKHIAISFGVISFAFWPGCTKTMEDGRTREKLNREWSFIKGDIENAQAYDFDDSGWRKLDIPHDWAIEGPFTEDVYFEGGYLPFPGVGWYRKRFTIHPNAGHVSVEFDGVMKDAKVWVNGEYVGGWAYGYSSFSFDITPFIKYEGENILAVRVENVDKSSRWYPGSGIYRNVWLTITNPVHVEHWGTYVTTPVVSDASAIVRIETWVMNRSQQTEEISLETTIIDAKGNVVSVNSTSDTIEGAGRLLFEQELKVEDPTRWDNEDPYLYTAINRVILQGEIVDTYETPFGIRTFQFDAEKGFFLNGRHLKLKGVNLHHGLGPLGIAISTQAIERQLQIMRDMGVNAIRTAHNPPAPELLDLCDQMGFLVIDETFDEWQVPKVPNGYNLVFDEWAEQDTRAMLLRDRNHPSIILWSIGNEIPELDTEAGKQNARNFVNICHDIDPTRPVTAGFHLSTIIDDELVEIFDVVGLNYWQDRYEELHSKYPDTPLLPTETAAVVSSRGEYHFPVERVPSQYWHNSLQISSYDLANCGFGTLPDLEFRLQEEHAYLVGEFVWSGFDYHGEPDPYEDMWPAHSSYFGIVDMCGFPKDRYYLYQSQWTEEPMIHVLPHWNWEGREGEIIPVYCYTNCASAELFVNGESVGKKKKRPGEYRLKWNDIEYQSGALKVVGYDDQGIPLCEKEIKTVGEPHRIELISDRNVIEANGEDLSFITVKIEDENGRLCPLADNLITFTVEGDGAIACVGNGNPISHESYRSDRRKAFHGMCLVVVRSTKMRGEIQIKASSPGLTGDSILIQTSSFGPNDR